MYLIIDNNDKFYVNDNHSLLRTAFFKTVDINKSLGLPRDALEFIFNGVVPQDFNKVIIYTALLKMLRSEHADKIENIMSSGIDDLTVPILSGKSDVILAYAYVNNRRDIIDRLDTPTTSKVHIMQALSNDRVELLNYIISKGDKLDFLKSFFLESYKGNNVNIYTLMNSNFPDIRYNILIKALEAGFINIYNLLEKSYTGVYQEYIKTIVCSKGFYTRYLMFNHQSDKVIISLKGGVEYSSTVKLYKLSDVGLNINKLTGEDKDEIDKLIYTCLDDPFEIYIGDEGIRKRNLMMSPGINWHDKLVEEALDSNYVKFHDINFRDVDILQKICNRNRVDLIDKYLSLGRCDKTIDISNANLNTIKLLEERGISIQYETYKGDNVEVIKHILSKDNVCIDKLYERVCNNNSINAGRYLFRYHLCKGNELEIMFSS